jgi:hypothetical protein
MGVLVYQELISILIEIARNGTVDADRYKACELLVRLRECEVK